MQINSAPPGGNASPVCSDGNDDGVNDCLLSCGAGELCPLGMECSEEGFCLWRARDYADCLVDLLLGGLITGVGPCAGDGRCFTTQTEPDDYAICRPQGCGSVADCPAPPAGGNPVVECVDSNGDGTGDCILSCPDSQTCPTGMTCLQGQCAWPHMRAPYTDCPPPPPGGDGESICE